MQEKITKEWMLSNMLQNGWYWGASEHVGKIYLSKGSHGWHLDVHYTMGDLLDALEYVNFKLGYDSCKAGEEPLK